MGERTVDVLADLRTVMSLYGIDLTQSITALAELIEAVRPAITEEGMDQAELDRLREAFASVGGAS